MYADDTAVYPLQTVKLKRCISVVDKCLDASRLNINSDGSRRTVSTHHLPAIRTGKDTICATNKARLLGVLISTYLTFDQHVTSVSGQCVNSALSVSR